MRWRRYAVPVYIGLVFSAGVHGQTLAEGLAAAKLQLEARAWEAALELLLEAQERKGSDAGARATDAVSLRSRR